MSPNIDEFRQKIVDRAAAIDRNYLILGKELFIVNHKKLYQDWGFATFAEYLTEEVGIGRRKGQRLRQLWKVLVKDLACRPADVMNLRYSNALAIIGIINRENRDEWLAKARVLTYGALDKEVREYNAARHPDAGEDEDAEGEDDAEPGASGKAKKTGLLVKRTFALYPEQDEVVEEALNAAERVSGGHKPGELLANICTNFLATRVGTEDKKAYLAFLMRKLEGLFGGKMVHLEDEEAIRDFEQEFGVESSS